MPGKEAYHYAADAQNRLFQGKGLTKIPGKTMSNFGISVRGLKSGYFLDIWAFLGPFVLQVFAPVLFKPS